eukprot:5043466-Pleurochrysis_carterae.AAC.1
MDNDGEEGDDEEDDEGDADDEEEEEEEAGHAQGKERADITEDYQGRQTTRKMHVSKSQNLTATSG